MAGNFEFSLSYFSYKIIIVELNEKGRRMGLNSYFLLRFWWCTHTQYVLKMGSKPQFSLFVWMLFCYSVYFFYSKEWKYSHFMILSFASFCYFCWAYFRINMPNSRWVTFGTIFVNLLAPNCRYCCFLIVQYEHASKMEWFYFLNNTMPSIKWL